MTLMKSWADKEKGDRSYNLDFLLLFVHGKQAGGDLGNDEYDRAEKLVSEWERRGGQAEEVLIKRNTVKNNPL